MKVLGQVSGGIRTCMVSSGHTTSFRSLYLHKNYPHPYFLFFLLQAAYMFALICNVKFLVQWGI